MSISIGGFLLWFLVATSASAQPQQWQKIEVGDSVTVEFPGAPTRKEMAAGIIYVCKSEQISFLTVAKQGAFESDASASELQDFYNGTLTGMLEAGGGGKIINQQSVVLNGFPAVRAQIAMNKNSKITGLYFNQVVLVNGTCYAQSVLVPGNATPTLLAEKDRFFTSFRTIRHRTNPGDPETHTSAYRLGHLLGQVVFYGGLGALVLFFWRRKGRSSKTV